MITYIVFDKLTRLCKIGKTTNFKKRLSTLSTSNLNLELVVLLNHVDESFLHRLYGSQRVKREWFKLSKEDIENILELEEYGRFI